MPLLLVKLWAVYPRLFERVDLRAGRRLVAVGLERASIAVLVAASIFQLATGLANAAQWYPWREFSFRTTHYALAWVAIGALLVHIAVKLPVIRAALGADVDDTTHDRETAVEPGPVSRRALLRTTWAAAGVAVLATAGGTVPWLRRVSRARRALRRRPRRHPDQQVRRGRRRHRHRGRPRLGARGGGRRGRPHPARPRRPPRDAAAHRRPADRLRRGLERDGAVDGRPHAPTCSPRSAPPAGATCWSPRSSRAAPSGVTVLPGAFADDDRTLLALELDGEPLSLDHGYPCRLIAPNRPGVLQTKWLSSLEVSA